MDARQEFAVRCYQWALLDSREEMEAGFPLVSRLGNIHAETYLSVMGRLDADRRQFLRTACVKRFHPQAVELLDDRMTWEEETLLESANDQRFEIVCADLAPALRISNRKLETLLKSELRARLGQQTPFRKTGPRMFLVESKQSPWVVTTRFDCGRRPEYYHHIDSDEVDRPNARGLGIADRLSIESWMGISSTTDWTLGSADSEEEIAKTMVDAVQRFLQRAPGLLEGLSPDE